ncbi:MAG: hypothetical protein M1469_11045 [Bacteroidetes bacterium]|nr:hypothetical protein [Bacteroidota bacterium]
MDRKNRVLFAEITTDEPKRVEPLLTEIVVVNAILRNGTGFKIRTTSEGESAQELNRLMLSALRRISKGTTLKA